MSNFNKSYRIRTNVGKDTSVHVKLDRDYDVLEIMSLKIDQVNNYKFHTSEYGVIAGRVLANDGFGIPNAKISVFINIDNNDINDVVKTILYPYNTTLSKDKNGVRYNLLPNEQINDCHTIIGTFPEKQYMLDNNSVLEIFDKYYKFTTRTNNAGDYMIFGVPVGSQTIHVDIDLSDIGILSQKPRDMVYKGYNIEQFENPNKFKHGTNLENLTQVISQDSITDVIPFWGDDNEGTIGITRCDINIQYKFEPTCIFMGSVVSDTTSNGISKKCIPTQGMGAMDEITTGSGTIEMIRKTYSGDVEEFQIKGTQLINGDGVWCYQIPMNLDYMMTDEFGNMVPTNNPDKGIPTRTRVRFRISMQDFDSDSVNMFRCKMLVPHNPDIYSDNCEDELDYNYGSATKESSYRDLFWNCVYSVKSYIPRIQKGSNWRNEKFTGFKRVNYYNDNNPIPYNNIRIKIPFMYRILCVLVKAFIWISGFANRFMYALARVFGRNNDNSEVGSGGLITLSGELCNDTLEYMCFIPGITLEKEIIASNNKEKFKNGMIAATIFNFFEKVSGEDTGKVNGEDFDDEESIDNKNKAENYTHNNKEGYRFERGTWNGEDTDKWVTIWGINVTSDMNRLIECIEMNLAEEYKVIQFDFYNDWINGLIYIPRWMRNVSKKRSFLFGAIKIGGKIKACNENYAYNKKINIVQQCGLKYILGTEYMNSVSRTNIGCDDDSETLNCHKSKQVRLEYSIFRNGNGGIVNSYLTNKNQYVYYFKPYENSNNKNIRLFATDIILLGSLNNNDKIGIPNILNEMVSSTYQMPPNIALTDSEIEGRYYRGQRTDYPNVYTGCYQIKNYDGDNGKCDHIILSSGKLVNGAEIGDYTEISGINWNYTGPLQGKSSGTTVNDLYKPGGHFLGLSCRNSETTIKTCVNLSRICEYGVWMSQRQELNVRSEEGAWFTPYSTSPTGIISGDEIKGNEYRRLFATMNNNRLRVKKDKNGYFIYDFKYLNPTNFGGELDWQINKHDGLKYNLNRFIYNGVFEYDAEVLNDDYTDFYLSDTAEGWVNDKIVMRTNEYLDKEYYKFRFGLDDSNINKKDEKKKRFLFYEKASDSGVEHVSFPMYDNSFYFYFGLHDGRTALDEFKKNYYAVCKNNETFVQNKLDKFVKCKNWRITYNGLCDLTNTGKIKFDIEISESLLIDNYIIVKLINNNNIIETIEITETKKEIIFDNLIEGNYNINITSLDNSINEDYNKEVGKLSISATIKSVDFYQDVSKLLPQEKISSNKLETGGYIKIKDNIYTYIDENGSFDENVFNVKNVNYIRIVDSEHDREFLTRRTDALDPIYPNIRYIYYELYGGCTLNQDTTGEWMIPVPYEDREYDVYLSLFIDNDCKIKILSSEDVDYLIPTVDIYLGRVRINNGAEHDILYNDVSYSSISKYIKEDTTLTSNTGWWAENWDDGESGLTRWRIKENLYTDVIPGSGKTHRVNISVMGVEAPYIEEVEGSKEDYITITGITRSDFENVSTPTLNYKGKGSLSHRNHFSYKVTDKNNITIPEKPFVFPVIYKPFFMEMSIWNIHINDGIKSFLYGNIYNGKTWDYKNEGFNNVILNGFDLLKNSNYPFTINITENDNHMEINEPVLTDNKGGYLYNGDGEYYKYNGRKVNISNEILPLYLGTKNSLEFSIGCLHVEDNTTYSDICRIDKQYANSYYFFNLKEKMFNNKKYIKYEAFNNNPSIFPPIKVYVFEDSNENTNGKYEYPLKDGKLNINEKLFRDLIDDKINMSGLNTFTIEGEDGYIDLSSYNYPSDKKYYYIAMPDNSDNMVVETSNRENKIKSISVSPLIIIDNWINK